MFALAATFTPEHRSLLILIQGYHDILSVLILTLCPESPPAGAFSPEGSPELAETLACAERVSLHLIRDSMTQDLDPVMGQLKCVPT